MPLFVNYALDIDSTPPLRVWTGRSDIMVDGTPYIAAAGVVEIGGVESGRHINNRATFTFPVVDDASRAPTLQKNPRRTPVMEPCTVTRWREASTAVMVRLFGMVERRRGRLVQLRAPSKERNQDSIS